MSGREGEGDAEGDAESEVESEVESDADTQEAGTLVPTWKDKKKAKRSLVQQPQPEPGLGGYQWR
jgi:hypothetical protein